MSPLKGAEWELAMTAQKPKPKRKPPVRSRPQSLRVAFTEVELDAIRGAAEREMLASATWARRVLLRAAKAEGSEGR